jgi:hypothetical protein
MLLRIEHGTAADKVTGIVAAGANVVRQLEDLRASQLLLFGLMVLMAERYGTSSLSVMLYRPERVAALVHTRGGDRGWGTRTARSTFQGSPRWAAT